MGRQASKHTVPVGGPVALPSAQAPAPCRKAPEDLLPVLSRDEAVKPGLHAPPAQREEVVPRELTEMEMQDLWEVLFGLAAEDEDVDRWLQSRFDFVGEGGSPEGEARSLPCPWGLRQELGGPCGVLAALQAQVVRELLWGVHKDAINPKELQRSLSAASTAASTTASESDSESRTGGSSPPTPRAAGAEVEAAVAAVADAVGPHAVEEDAEVAEVAREECEAAAAGAEEEAASTTVAEGPSPAAAFVSEAPSAASLVAQGPSSAAASDSEASDAITGASGMSCEALLSERFASVRAQELLACAITRMLHTAAPDARYVWCSIAGMGCAFRYEFSSAAALQTWLASDDGLACAPCQVLSMVCSLLLTRGLSTIRDDMDDATVPLVGVFGHCSQELTNLCLTGRATTNIFDGDLAFEDGEDSLRLKGVSGFPEVGFLSALEPLRLCEVGSFLKNPRYPLWVVASATHYSLLFSGDCRASHMEGKQEKTPSDDDDLVGEAHCPSCGLVRTAAADEQGVAPLRLLHFNGKEFGVEKPVLAPVEIRQVGGPSGTVLLTGDEDSRLFAEVLRSRWPGAEVSYPGIGDTNGEGSPPRIN